MLIYFKIYWEDSACLMVSGRSHKGWMTERFAAMLRKLNDYGFSVDGSHTPPLGRMTKKAAGELASMIVKSGLEKGYIDTVGKSVVYLSTPAVAHRSVNDRQPGEIGFVTPNLILEHFSQLVLNSDETLYHQIMKYEYTGRSRFGAFGKTVRILYVHGLGSSDESGTAKYLCSLSNDKYKIIARTFSVRPERAMQEINQTIIDENIDFVVGTSIGGFYALNSLCSFGVVVNPAIDAPDDIEKSIGLGEHEYTHPKDGFEKYVIDREFINQLKAIKGTDEYREKAERFIGIFGDHDELFSHYHDLLALQVSRRIACPKLIDSGHHLNPECYAELKGAVETMVNYLIAVRSGKKPEE